MTDGRLLEIKSTHSAKMEQIRAERRLPRRHFEQVQCYMRHGGYSEAVVVYVARDTGEVWVDWARQMEDVGRRLDEKAHRVLAALDTGERPACECGRHG